MDEQDSILVTSRAVRCDGGGGALGHPAVFLKIGPSNDIVCPYCSRHFVLETASEPAESHG